jgi:hypothetical protein
MAARKRRMRMDGQWRQAIQTSMLLNRLQDCAFGKVELTQTRLKAIEILLKKTIPDLSSIELTGDADNPVRLVIESGVPRDQG